VPGAARDRVEERWRRLRRLAPRLAKVIEWPHVHEQDELESLLRSCAFTYRLDAPSPDPQRNAGYLGARASLNTIRQLTRPGLYEATADWRLLLGTDHRPRVPERDRQARRAAAWLELSYWWRWAFRACLEPSGPRAADIAMKIVAEPARIWLWLARGERPGSREAVLRRALELMPEEHGPLTCALGLRARIARDTEPQLRIALEGLVSLSARIAELIEAEVAAAGATPVRLIGDEPHALCDWRALALTPALDETFALLPGSASDP